VFLVVFGHYTHHSTVSILPTNTGTKAMLLLGLE